MVQRALLVGAYFDRREIEEAVDLLDELQELVETLGIGVVTKETAMVREFNPRYIVGKGKAAELMAQAKAMECDCIVFDNELSPAQQRAWESESGLCVIDRHEVILDIFAMRARTSEARLQVELARLAYSLPRLTRMWAHLDRQGGGAGGAGSGGAGAARGEGETQLETDRRLAHKRIDKVKAELEDVKRNRDTQRKERSRVPVPHVAIVGYTNAGKSSLLNAMTGSDVVAQNQLFVTLDTTTRRMELPDGQNILLTDTVGFVRRLPHDLVQSFRATLEEAVIADFLIHVLDASDARAVEFHKTTTSVLGELGAGDKRVVLVLNKIDLIEDEGRLQELQRHFPDAVPISVKTGDGMDKLMHRLHEMLLDRVVRLKVAIPMNRLDLVSIAHQEGKVLREKYTEHGVQMVCVLPKRWESRFNVYSDETLDIDESDSELMPA
ncbi:MAG: GTP-binding protein HflX [Verrucomicrobiaceae bacterium]|nr:GTP-binding protein HflX [Verrucomicrobiaceae bacterium]